MPRLLDSFPGLRNRIPRYSTGHVLTLEEWENRVDPVLFDLNRSGSRRAFRARLEEKCIFFSGNDAGLEDWRGETLPANGPADLYVYSFGRLDDLALLRRVKEFPDETPRREIEDYWLGECAENRSILILNPEKA